MSKSLPAPTATDRRLRARAAPDAPAAEVTLILEFLERAWAEQGLARQTQDSYRRDLEAYARWLGERRTPLLAADRADLHDYLAVRAAQGYSARSNARLLSTLRRFYAQMLRLGRVNADPTALLASPRLPRSLPRRCRKVKSRRCYTGRKSPPPWACAIAPCSNSCMARVCGSVSSSGWKPCS